MYPRFCKISIFTVAVIASCLGCSKLGRDKAFELLVPEVKRDYIYTFGRGVHHRYTWEERKSLEDEDMENLAKFGVVKKTGKITSYSPAGSYCVYEQFEFIPTPEGRKIFKKASASYNRGIYVGVSDMTFKICERCLQSVTGISREGNTATVTFIYAEGNPTIAFQALPSWMKSKYHLGEKKAGKALLNLYDDGWRVEHIFY